MQEVVFADLFLKFDYAFTPEGAFSAIATSSGRVRCKYERVGEASVTVDWTVSEVCLAELNMVAYALREFGYSRAFGKASVIDGPVGNGEFRYLDGHKLGFSANSPVWDLCHSILEIEDHRPDEDFEVDDANATA